MVPAWHNSAPGPGPALPIYLREGGVRVVGGGEAAVRAACDAAGGGVRRWRGVFAGGEGCSSLRGAVRRPRASGLPHGSFSALHRLHLACALSAFPRLRRIMHRVCNLHCVISCVCVIAFIGDIDGLFTPYYYSFVQARGE